MENLTFEINFNWPIQKIDALDGYPQEHSRRIPTGRRLFQAEQDAWVIERKCKKSFRHRAYRL